MTNKLNWQDIPGKPWGVTTETKIGRFTVLRAGTGYKLIHAALDKNINRTTHKTRAQAITAAENIVINSKPKTKSPLRLCR